MLNKIIKASLQNRVAVLIISALILLGGVVALMRMDVDIFPDLNAPTVVVMTEAPGLAPEEVETVVTYPIETAMNGATGVRRVRSSSTTGFSVVWVEFDWDTDIYLARQIVGERLDRAGQELPDGVEQPIMGPQSSILGEAMIIGLTADTTSMIELRRLAEKVISPKLLSVVGVSQVSVIGGDMPEYRICLDPERMRLFDISLNEVLDATEQINDNAGAGIVNDYGNEYIIKGVINTDRPEEIAAAVVRSDNRGIVTLTDIADVEIGGQQPRIGAASVKGQPAVLITITKQPDTGTIGLTEAIDNRLEEISRTLPPDIVISDDIFRQSDFIDSSISNLQQTLLEGALFVIIVLFFFLMNLRTTLISIVAIPMSIIVTILAMHFMGYTINTMSLGGIAIAIGCLVDDAIVDVENVYKRLRQNMALPTDERQTTVDVVYHASAEVRMPIFNSTLIIMSAFLPLFLLSGMEGRMLIPLGVSFIIALAASTIVALTLTPVLCSYLLGGKNTGKNEYGHEPAVTRRMRGMYIKSLRIALSHKKTILSTVALLFLISIALFFTLGRGFLPPFNEGSFTINVSSLPGISLEESDKIGREAERIIMMTPEIRTVARKTGRAELDEHSLGVNVSEIEAPYTLSGRTRSEVANELRERLSEIPGTVIEIGQPISHRIDAMLSGTQSQIAIKIFGDDLNSLFATGRKIHDIVLEVDGVVDANIEQQIERPELTVRPRRDMLAAYGITMADFRRVLAIALGGTTVSQVYSGGNSYDVTLIAGDNYRNTLDAIRDYTIDSNRGKIPLEAVAEITSTTGPNTINRENTSRRLVVSANVEGRDLRGTVDEIRRRIETEVDMPQNYYVSYGGQFESEESASRTLMLASLGAILLIFLLLYSEFRDMAESLIILINMPLALIGGVLILFFTGAEVNIPAIIGFISLMGISTRNGMLLISRYNNLEAEGNGIDTRIMTGSADRLLPIVMTALTSALALIPLAIGASDPGNEIQSPMAIVILGGLLSSTILNIYVVPVCYRILMSHRSKKNRK
jgi:CzcA family heavy metal efflux pump